MSGDLDARMQDPDERQRGLRWLALGPNPKHEKLLKSGAHKKNKAKWPYSGPAIYFLWLGKEIVYIGRAVNVLRRVAEHSKDKDFDHYSYIRCGLDELDELERRAIIWFCPRLNKL